MATSYIAIEEVIKLCFEKFESLPKTGKPRSNEWTVLSGVVVHNRRTATSHVVSLGCGTKCIGRSKLCPQGFIINDSHAEVMARRGLLRYIYYQLHEAITGKQGMFEWVQEKKKFQIRDEFTLHFLSTQTPCGDACIMPVNQTECNKEPPNKKSKTDGLKIDEYHIESPIDSVYTGAKLIGSYHSDAMEQIEGALRTKPGRGERTLSMSCSDKLAKWQIIGVQGALLDNLLTKPIYFDTLNFLGNNNVVSLERAIWKRFQHNHFTHPKYKLRIPDIRICNSVNFSHAQCNKDQPSANSSVWCDIPNNMKPYEISVNGKKQGITSRQMNTPHSALKISKFFLLKEFLNVVKLKPELISYADTLELKSYAECKLLGKDYQSAWSDIKMYYFKEWTEKPDILLKFSVQEVENKYKNA